MVLLRRRLLLHFNFHYFVARTYFVFFSNTFLCCLKTEKKLCFWLSKSCNFIRLLKFQRFSFLFANEANTLFYSKTVDTNRLCFESSHHEPSDFVIYYDEFSIFSIESTNHWRRWNDCKFFRLDFKLSNWNVLILLRLYCAIFQMFSMFSVGSQSKINLVEFEKLDLLKLLFFVV